MSLTKLSHDWPKGTETRIYNESRLLLAPAALGYAQSIRYTARLELATVVPRALARCRFSKSHHRLARVGRAASAVAPCRFSTAYFVEIGNFARVSAFLRIKGRNFRMFFIRYI